MRRSALAIAVVLLLFGAFWWLDFRAAAGESHAELHIASYSSGQPTATERGRDQAVTVVVQGDEALAKAVGKVLAITLNDGGLFATVTRIDGEVPPPADRPALVVEVTRTSGIWTPVYGQSELKVDLAYGSDGDLTWRGTQPVVMPFDHPTFRLEGTIEVSDVQWGLTSRPAYEHQLAGQVAMQVTNSLRGNIAAIQPGDSSSSQSKLLDGGQWSE